MKICHVITRMIVGGAQENTLYSCRGLLEQGHDVTLVTGPSLGPEGKLLAGSCPPGLKLQVIPELVREISPWKDWKAYRKLRSLFRENQYDVVHTHASKAGILGRMAAWDAKIPCVVHTVHGNAFGPYCSFWRNLLYIFLEHLAAAHCHRIYTVAQAMIRQCVDAKIAPADLYRVVYSGMDLSAFVQAKPDPELKKQLGIPPDAPVIGVIARLFPLKGHEFLLRAAPDIVQKFPEVRFLFIGDGILRQTFERQIQAMGLKNHFIFAGLIRPEEVCRYTALMTILVHLSLREGLPRAAVQGLAAGIPVVAYPLDGTPEVVHQDVTGELVPVGNDAALTEAVTRLLKNPERRKRMGENGQRFVLERFDWHKMSDILLADYQSLLQNFHSPSLKSYTVRK